MKAKDEFRLMAQIAPMAFELMRDPDIKEARELMKQPGAKPTDVMRLVYPAIYGRQADNLFGLYALTHGITVEAAQDTETDDILKWMFEDEVFDRIAAFFPSAVRLVRAV